MVRKFIYILNKLRRNIYNNINILIELKNIFIITCDNFLNMQNPKYSLLKSRSGGTKLVADLAGATGWPLSNREIDHPSFVLLFKKKKKIMPMF